MADAPAAAFEKETIGSNVRATGLLKLSPESVEVRGAEGSHADAASRHQAAFSQPQQPQTKLQQFIVDQNGPEHPPKRLDRVARQIYTQILAPLFQPEPLHQHEETADVIGVKMGNKN